MNDEIKTLGPVIKWPGAKWKISEWIVGHLPAHDCYIEPYFGSGAILFKKAPAQNEIINDRDGSVVNLFRVLREPLLRAALIEAVAFTPWAREEYDECRQDIERGDEVERARRLLVTMWQAIGQRRGKNREERDYATSGWRNRGGGHSQNPAITWRRLPERIEAAAARLVNCQIENRPALDVIVRNSREDVLIYADPPYVMSTRSRAMYGFEMDDADHIELLQALESHPGPVVLSGYGCRLCDERLAHWKRFTTRGFTQSVDVREEVLWLNPVAVRRLDASCNQLCLAGVSA